MNINKCQQIFTKPRLALSFGGTRFRLELVEGPDDILDSVDTTSPQYLHVFFLDGRLKDVGSNRISSASSLLALSKAENQ